MLLVWIYTSVVDPHWFNAVSDPDPDFYLNVDQDPLSQTNADPDPGYGSWSDFKVTKS